MIWPFHKPHENPVVRQYLAGTGRRWSPETPLAALPLVAIDLETSGFRVGMDLILSVGTVAFQHGVIKVSGVSNWIVRHDRSPVNEATAVHGILPSQSGGGDPETEILNSLLPILEGAILVGHHVAFDIAMLDDSLRRAFGIRLLNRKIDTAHLAMATIDAFYQSGYSNQRPPTLDEVCTKVGVPMIERHTAAGDAFTAAELFLVLCAKRKQLLGRELTLGDLLQGR